MVKDCVKGHCRKSSPTLCPGPSLQVAFLTCSQTEQRLSSPGSPLILRWLFWSSFTPAGGEALTCWSSGEVGSEAASPPQAPGHRSPQEMLSPAPGCVELMLFPPWALVLQYQVQTPALRSLMTPGPDQPGVPPREQSSHRPFTQLSVLGHPLETLGLEFCSPPWAQPSPPC